MSIPKKLTKIAYSLYRQILKLSRSITKAVMNWLLRSLIVMGRRVRLSESGFILPTVTMVILVVMLLTTAIVFRSFDRAKNANNVRIDQALLNSATPAIERAKAKLDTLFADARLPRGTPSDASLYGILANNDDDKYTFEDENRLKLAYDIDGGGITNESTLGSGTLENWETLSTAWRFPVDTDNDGKFDSFTLYGVFFRSPSRETNGEFARARMPLDARVPPQDDGIGSGFCEAALTTSAKLVSESGWYKSGSKLKKSFLVYTVTVPITNIQELGLNGNQYENYTGSKGLSALEYQQDRARIPLSNNAVVYEDDLEISPGGDFFLNGRVMTNSNLFVAKAIGSAANIRLYQVSSPKSCFYDEENSKILAGGNTVNSVALAAAPSGGNVEIHLFKEQETPATSQISTANQSVKGVAPQNVAYNSKAYTDRINFLVNSWVATNALPTQPGTGAGVPNLKDPEDVQTRVKASQASQAEAVRLEALRGWFEDRTRRVPFAEVPYNAAGTSPTFTAANRPIGEKDSLRPPKNWMYPVEPNDGKTATSYANVALNINGQKVQPPATEPQTLEKQSAELFVGDRALVGNNLPATWYKADNYNNNNGTFVADKEGQPIDGTVWDKDDSSEPQTRERFTSVRSLDDVGDKGRDGFWEKAAAKAPKNILEGVGGLRIVTGAGVYERRNSFLPQPQYQNPTTGITSATYDDPNTPGVQTFPIVWPDTMPMSPNVQGLAPTVQPTVFDNSNPNYIPGSPPSSPSSPPIALLNPLPAAQTPTIDPNTPQYAKGDLRMRATAVYHYAQDKYQDPSEGTDQQQRPIACVSSYYDPSYRITKGSTTYDSSRNSVGLPPSRDIYGNVSGAIGTGKSNNGISYGVGRTSATVGRLTPNATTGLFPPGINPTYTTLEQKLGYQANLVFPNGRFVNEPLRRALQKVPTARTLSDQSAIDSTICALQILDRTITPTAGVIPYGAIKEVAFLDARQVQRLDADDANPATPQLEASPAIEPFVQAKQAGYYNLSLAERQPLEIRATQIDLDLLQGKTIGITSTPVKPPDNKEYLLPNSGIIYATRDDALPDLSAPPDPTLNTKKEQQKAKQLSESAVDYRLDPTRRPNGIMLIKGSSLAREDQQTFREVEKGLILATNLPTYILAQQPATGTKGEFNIHTQQEFTQPLTPNWNNFYTRTTPNQNFACRPGDDRLPNCSPGDQWRPATIISDAITLLSNNFQFGFRNEGDYDLRNNQGWAASYNPTTPSKRQKNGFFDNNFVTNGLSSKNLAFGTGRNFTDATYSGTPNNATNEDSSYFNNFVTPVQRRKDFPEYVMEICRKLPVSECTPNDWVVGTAATPSLKASQIPLGTAATALLSGTTARPPLNPEDQRYARRVAFLRDPIAGSPTENQLFLDTTNGNTPVAIGIKANQVSYSAYKNVSINLRGASAPDNHYDPSGGTPYGVTAGFPDTQANALWFAATNRFADPPGDRRYTVQPLHYKNPLTPGTTDQPLLVPVLQVHVTTGPSWNGTTPQGNIVNITNWLPSANESTFNLLAASGNTPMRPSESDGGLPNFPRFLENWRNINASISGSLLEFDRSRYATAPFQSSLNPPLNPTDGLLGYPLLSRTDNTGGTVGYYAAPNRDWGYDVGLLSQLPDLFAAQFTTPPSGPPDEFFREVSRDDDWVQSLLCARTWNANFAQGQLAVNAVQRPTDYCEKTTDES
ncbi:MULTISPECIES: hormogonium polysaccharide biosynthesis protein HpsA [unclassified Coleofasciculus]|uniref:hormogonium polysaccharide biosynthesis protein HpsA n=1 Tax=unclassified Coleofasciculus TaxID=2692782 RepID=UPI00188108F3|nr:MULTISPECIES: hormogonium polysaccharide biosynthesis protein HpsA [unclassified Coleofasciculus]MBE9126703.1 hypothetical protein [Coleofasciculus sp. LEGE 07081]MBE9150063.1 hypothetical protein [Coleofasciculus sp. LEGE 07092]